MVRHPPYQLRHGAVPRWDHERSFDGKEWSNPNHGGGRAAGYFIKWYTIRNQDESVLQDVRRIRAHPLVPRNIPIYGYVYDVKTGRLNEVVKASEAGRAA